MKRIKRWKIVKNVRRKTNERSRRRHIKELETENVLLFAEYIHELRTHMHNTNWVNDWNSDKKKLVKDNFMIFFKAPNKNNCFLSILALYCTWRMWWSVWLFQIILKTEICSIKDKQFQLWKESKKKLKMKNKDSMWMRCPFNAYICFFNAAKSL